MIAGVDKSRGIYFIVRLILLDCCWSGRFSLFTLMLTVVMRGTKIKTTKVNVEEDTLLPMMVIFSKGFRIWW